MRGIRRVLAVTAVTLVAFVVAVAVLQDDARAGCATSGDPDPSYQAELLSDVETSGTDYRFEITRDGEPVKGAAVCLDVAMMGMTAMGMGDTAEEVAPGIYETSIIFEMAGDWSGTVLVSEQGESPVGIPVEFEVR